MVYDWDNKESECYRLYVEERKSLDEVMDYFKQREFAPRYVRSPYRHVGRIACIRPPTTTALTAAAASAPFKRSLR